MTIREEIELSKESFENSNELIQELAEANGFKIAWTVVDEDLSKKDCQLINALKVADWGTLDNL
ncbi:MAG: hypothetical protein RIF33_11600 [Cyclobacteriaceae bacterium]